MAQTALVAMMSSPKVQEHAVARGFRSMSHIFYPFQSFDLTVREPVNDIQNKINLRLEIRDIAIDGHLLSLSVLPHVLVESLKADENVYQAIEQFKSALKYWAESSEHELFGSYLACIFVVSVTDENPLGELSKMIQTQQTLYNSTSTLIIPPHCCPPKWEAPHVKTPKHYILLDDRKISKDQDRTDNLFKQMCSTYGSENCQILELKSTEEYGKVNSSWEEYERFSQLLDRGLRVAMTQASSSTTPSSPTETSHSVSTISVERNQFTPSKNDIKNLETRALPSPIKLFSDDDSTNCFNVINSFAKKCLMPYLERQLARLYDSAGSRRGLIGKSLTSGMRKWFTTGNSQNNIAIPASYSWDSPEMQSRRLADLAYICQLYQFAYQQYRALKKDFEAEQAMIPHAQASEFCAIALKMSETTKDIKDFPVHYFENAINHLVNNSAKHVYTMRAAINVYDVLGKMEMYKETTAILSKINRLDQDYFVAVVNALMAKRFMDSKKYRKAVFHLILAGNRFSKASIPSAAFDCFRKVSQVYDDHNCGVLDDYISLKLLSEKQYTHQLGPTLTFNCIQQLLESCSRLPTNEQPDRFKYAIQLLHENNLNNMDIQLPKVNTSDIRIIYGERPLWNEIDDEENKKVSIDDWNDVERAAHYTLYGSSTPFRPVQLISDAYTDNQKIREIPVGERYRVMMDLTNPISTELILSQLRLDIADIKTVVDGEVAENVINLGVLPHFVLPPNETKTIELYVIPKAGCASFSVRGLLFNVGATGLDVSISCKLPLSVRGKRLTKTHQQRKSKMYAPDERLKAKAVQNTWPLAEFRILKAPSKWTYCDQALRYMVEIENIGNEDIVSICLATNGFDRVSAACVNQDETSTEIPLQIAPNSSQIGTFLMYEEGKPLLAIKEKKRIVFDVRAGSETSNKSSVILIAYRGANGSMREWRKVVDGERRRLVAVDTELLDPDSGLVAIKLLNCLSSNQATLSRVEILRLRCAQNGKVTSSHGFLEVKNLHPRKIEVESDQSDTIVTRIVPDSTSSVLWISSKDANLKLPIPNWPCPATEDAAFEEAIPIVQKKIGVLWKASIVNNEGHVSSFVGETFVDDPIENEKVMNTNEKGAKPSLKVTCVAENSINHDFKKSRICEIPIRVVVKNSHDTNVNLLVKYLPKISDPIEGVHLVAPESRQQVWVDRPVQRNILCPNETKDILLKVRVSNASVYDVGGNNLVIEASIDGNDQTYLYKVPSILSVVKSI